MNIVAGLAGSRKEEEEEEEGKEKQQFGARLGRPMKLVRCEVGATNEISSVRGWGDK